MDPFAQLPEEVLQEVFKHVPSLPEKFKLAAVNLKFRGGIMEMLGKPMNLKLNYEDKMMNGVEVPHNKWLAALEVLAECTDFKEIRIHRSSSINKAGESAMNILFAAMGTLSHEWPTGLLDAILDILIKKNSLSEATAFESELGSGAMIERFLKECPKMAEVWLLSPVSRMLHRAACNVDLRSALGGKAVTYLRLKLQKYPLAELSAFFKSLQPNTLKQYSLGIDYSLDVVQLIKELSGSAWAALEALEIGISESSGDQLELLGLLVTQLPRLRKCGIIYKPFGKHDTAITLGQFAAAVVSMFTGRKQSDQTALEFFYKDSRQESYVETVSGCYILELVRRIRQKHPELQFEHGEHLGRIELTLANLKFTCFGDVVPCLIGCGECRSFFPIVVDELGILADTTRRNGHLENHQLDRCRVGRVAEEMNIHAQNYKALSAVTNEAQDQATITFEAPNGQQFYITIACGRCFNKSCVKCLVV